MTPQNFELNSKSLAWYRWFFDFIYSDRIFQCFYKRLTLYFCHIDHSVLIWNIFCQWLYFRKFICMMYYQQLFHYSLSDFIKCFLPMSILLFEMVLQRRARFFGEVNWKYFLITLYITLRYFWSVCFNNIDLKKLTIWYWHKI